MPFLATLALVMIRPEFGQTAAVMHTHVLDVLGPELILGSHPPGSVLRIEDLCTRFSMSRSVIREAVRVLESMRLVTSRRRVGLIVLPRERWNVFDPQIIRWRLQGSDRERQLRSLAGLRVAIEPVAAAGAARNATTEDARQLLLTSERMAEAAENGDLEALLDLDISFHRALLHSSGNEMLSTLDEVVAESLTGRTVYGLMPAQPERIGLALHAAVAHAVKARDPETAENAMRALTSEVESHFGM
jgi:DNA-binding FadR family transcriptional regulator